MATMAPPVLMVLVVVFAFDLNVMDLQSTKDFALRMGVSLWAGVLLMVALVQPRRRPPLALPRWSDDRARTRGAPGLAHALRA